MNHFGSDDLIGSALQVPPGGPKYVGALPLATLQGLGTGTPVRVSAVAGAESWAWDTTNKRPVYCLTATASASTWGYKVSSIREWNGQVSVIGTEYYLALNGGVIATSLSYVNQHSYRYDGVLKNLTIGCDNATLPGTVTAKLYKGDDGADATDLLDTQSVAVASALTFYEMEFDEDAAFSADQSVAISLSPSSTGPSNLTGSIEFEYVRVAD